jgi:hypothetical protein
MMFFITQLTVSKMWASPLMVFTHHTAVTLDIRAKNCWEIAFDFQCREPPPWAEGSADTG